MICVAFAHHQAGSVLPSADVVSRRGKLRGLGQELIRMDYAQDLKRQRLWVRKPRYNSTFRCWAFIAAADPDLHNTLKPYADGELVEAHGEQLLDLHVRLASELDWNAWIRSSVEVAAASGNPQVFRRLLEVGPSVSELCAQEADWAFGLLLRAARGGSPDIFLSLVAIGGFLALARSRPGHPEDPPGHQDRKLLDAAACGGSLAILGVLLDTDDGFLALVDMRAYTDMNDTEMWMHPHSPLLWTHPHSPLHLAAKNGHARFAAALIEAGAPLEYKFKMQGISGGTALEAAVSHGHAEVVLELLSAGADITVKDSYETPLLVLAADQNHEGVVEVLLAAGADLGEDRATKLPLHAAAKKGCCGPLAKLLLAGANADWADSMGRSALHLACAHGHEDAVELLLRHNASVTSLCDKGLSPHDVVAVEALKAREGQGRAKKYSFPSTLDAAQTLAADRICGMMRGACAWRRRGWLVMLRARQGTARTVDVSALAPSSSSTPRLGYETAPLDATLAKHNAGDDSTSVAVAVAADVTPHHTVEVGGPGHAMTKGLLSTGATVDGGDENDGQARRSGWQGAVDWLMQCPDERGVFREILSFL